MFACGRTKATGIIVENVLAEASQE